MSDFLLSFIRTYVPIIIGGLISWLATKGIDLDESSAQALIVGVTGFITALYYFVVRVLESLWPSFGILLGSKKQPEYFELD